MNIREILKQTPQQPDESVHLYITRICELNPDLVFESVRRVYYRATTTKMVVAKTSRDADGNLKGYTEKVVQDRMLEVDLPIVRLSTNVATGQQWKIQQALPLGAKEVIENNIKPMLDFAMEALSRNPVKLNPSKTFNKRIVFDIITDVHGGMSTEGGFLNYEWNSKLLIKGFEENLQSLTNAYNQYGRFENLVLMDLGDTLDGYEGLTTRGGHKLDQNMTSEQQFALVLNAYMSLIEAALENDISDKITVHRAENDNHNGSFNQILGTTLETVLKRLYPKANLNFVRQSDFIAYQKYGENSIVTTHGKDKKFMKHGMPLVMNAKWEQYLNSILQRWGLLNTNVKVFKGDLHTLGMSSHTFFEYYNMPAFSPPSGWCQHNIGNSKNIGYAIHTFGEQKGSHTTLNHNFDWL